MRAVLKEALAWRGYARRHMQMVVELRAKLAAGETSLAYIDQMLGAITHDTFPPEVRIVLEDYHHTRTVKKNVRTREHMRRLRHGRETGAIQSPAVMSVDDLPDNIDDILKEMESTRPPD